MIVIQIYAKVGLNIPKKNIFKNVKNNGVYIRKY